MLLLYPAEVDKLFRSVALCLHLRQLRWKRSHWNTVGTVRHRCCPRDLNDPIRSLWGRDTDSLLDRNRYTICKPVVLAWMWDASLRGNALISS